MASFMAFPYAGDPTMRARMAGELKGIAVLTHTHSIHRVRAVWPDTRSFTYSVAPAQG